MKNKILFIVAIFIALSIFVGTVYAGSQQTSGVTAQTIIDRARYYLKDQDADPHWPNAELLVHLNYGLIDIATKSYCLQTTEMITLSTSVSAYAISTAYFDIEAIVDNSDSGVTNRALIRGNVQSIGHSKTDNNTVKYPDNWVDWGGSVIIYPEPEGNVSGRILTAYLYERPTEIILTGAIVLPPIYEKSLIYYIVKEAFKKDKQSALFQLYEGFFKEEMESKREFFNKRPKESEEITK